MRVRLALLAGTAVLIGIGVFLASQGAGKASEDASIASFFLAVPVAVAAIVALAEGRSKSRNARQAEDKQAISPPSQVQVIQRRPGGMGSCLEAMAPSPTLTSPTETPELVEFGGTSSGTANSHQPTTPDLACGRDTSTS
jgi:hypothetical protein